MHVKHLSFCLGSQIIHNATSINLFLLLIKTRTKKEKNKTKLFTKSRMGLTKTIDLESLPDLHTLAA